MLSRHAINCIAALAFRDSRTVARVPLQGRQTSSVGARVGDRTARASATPPPGAASAPSNIAKSARPTKVGALRQDHEDEEQ